MTEIYVVMTNGYDSGSVIGWSKTLEGAKAIGDAHFNGYWERKRRAAREDAEGRGRLLTHVPVTGWEPLDGFTGEVLQRPVYVFGASAESGEAHEWICVHRLSADEYIGFYRESA